MLEHLPCVRIDPAPFRPQPISNMDGRAIRFELERQACQSLRQVLQLKLQQRRTREELVNQGIMPPLKSSSAFHEQRRSLERARTEDYLKRKMKSRPEKSELIRMHILEDSAAEPRLQAKQLQLKRARLADDLNDKIAHRPGPMELIHKNILPIHSSIKQAIIETDFSKASGETTSCDEDSNASLSPGQPVSQECPLALGLHFNTGSNNPSPTQATLSAPSPLSISGSSVTRKLTNGKAAANVQGTAANTHIKPKSSCDRSAQKHKKAKDNKPKVKKLKYHQYIPPDQKGDKEPPPHLDSSYAKILQQQQLFLQLQILNQQQQHYNYQTILPAPPKSQTDQAPSSTSSSSSLPQPSAAASSGVSIQRTHTCDSSAPSSGTKPASLPSNLDEMKVAELKCELKLRSLPLSGTKNDLIERLRTYQELNGGSDTTSFPTAGGTTGPGAEDAAASCRTAAATNNNTSTTPQQTSQYHQTSMHTVNASPAAATPQHLLTCGVMVAPPPASLLSPSDHSPMSPEDGSFTSEPLGELMSSPLPPLCLETSSANLQTPIKEEAPCSAPCQFSLRSSSLQKLGPASSSAAHAVDASALPALTDKDRMLREKDRQIEELTRMLRQKQMLVDLLKRQLEHGNREGRVSEPFILVRIKEEPPDKPGVASSTGNPPSISDISHDMDATVKEEVAEEAEEAPSDPTVQLSGSETLLQPLDQTREVQEQVHVKPDKKIEQQYVYLQQTAMQLAQQQAIQKLLLQQQSLQKQRQAVQNPNQVVVNPKKLQKLCQQKKKKSQKLQLKQQQEQKQLSQSQEQQSKHLQQMQLKQQILLKQQKSLLQHQVKTQQHSKQVQQIQIQTKMHMKQQQQAPTQQKQAQQQSAQTSCTNLQQPSGSASSFPLDLLKSDSTPTLVTDGNGNHFLIALTNHTTGNQRGEASEGKTANHITLQRLQSTGAKLQPGQSSVQLTRADHKTKQSTHLGVLKQPRAQTHNGGLEARVEKPQQDAAPCLSAPPTLQFFFKDPDTVPSGKNTLSPSSQTELCPSLDVLFTPLSPASVKTATSSPDDKDTEHEDDFIDIIMQTGEMKPTAEPSLHLLYPNSTQSPQLLSPSCPPCCDSPQPGHPADQPEPRALASLAEDKRPLGRAGSGRLEDFLESATGKPLLGVEPGGLLTVIDDLNSQMLCTPSILDHPSSPMDTFDILADGEQELDNMDWLDFTTGREKEEERPTLAPLGPQTPPSVFSTDFLDSYDLYIHWDSSL